MSRKTAVVSLTIVAPKDATFILCIVTVPGKSM
jgi:hypothetical protein